MADHDSDHDHDGAQSDGAQPDGRAHAEPGPVGHVPADQPAPTFTQVAPWLTMPLVEAMESQRAVRKVRFDDVDPAIIRRCVELGLKGPTGSNGQNWEFVVVRDRQTKALLARNYRRIWPWYRKVGPRLVGRRTNDPSMAKVLASVEWQIDNFEDIPVLLVPCLKGGRPPIGPAGALGESSYYGSIYPSVQNVLLAARAMGLGASLITLPLWNRRPVRKALGLPGNVRPACVIPLGWPRGRYGPTTRRPVDEVLHLDRYGTTHP